MGVGRGRSEEGCLSRREEERERPIADVGTAHRGYPQLQSMVAIIFGEA